MISSLVSGSRLPVGSSASISFGEFNNALATSILCCSPPLSSKGILFLFRVRFTLSNTSAILSSISFSSFQPEARRTNFRFSVKIFIPELTRDAWKIKNSFIVKLNPLATEKTYRYKFDKKNYRKEFATLKVQSTLLEIILGGLPKYGPLSRFKPMVPDSVSEILFEQSFETILANYSGTLKKLKSGELAYDNVDLDTGEKTSMGEYELADKTYYDLLMKLRRDKSANINDALKKNLIAYYSNRDSSSKYRSNTHKGKKITKALRQLNVAYVAQQELN